MSNNVGIGIADAGEIILTNNTTGKVELYTPYANTANFSHTSSRFYANGQGMRLISWDTDQQETLTLNLEVFELKWLPVLLGGSWSVGTHDWIVREEFTGALSVTLDNTPQAGTVSIWELEADNIGHKTDGEIVEGDATNPQEFEITGASVTMNAAEVGKKLVAFYFKDTAATAERFAVTVGSFPGTFSVDCITTIRRQYDGVDEEFQMHIGNARPMSEMSISFSETEATSLEIVFDVFPDANKELAVFTRA